MWHAAADCSTRVPKKSHQRCPHFRRMIEFPSRHLATYVPKASAGTLAGTTVLSEVTNIG
jgi:hypothetical protein